MKNIIKSKTFQKGEDMHAVRVFLEDQVDYEICDIFPINRIKYKTIITITKVVDEETKPEVQ